MSIGCKIKKNFERSPIELVELFRDIQVANIDDCMGRIAAVDAAIKPLGKGQLLGTAFTIRVPQGDNLMFHAAMDIAKSGDVFVIDAGGISDRAIFGELMATYCKTRGVKGIICDEAVRDSSALANMEDFQIYARAVSPNGPYKNGPGEINVPVIIGGKLVSPGDIVIGDEDGIVFVSPEDAVKLAEATRKIERKESEIMEKIISEGTYLRPWVDEKLAEISCEIL